MDCKIFGLDAGLSCEIGECRVDERQLQCLAQTFKKCRVALGEAALPIQRKPAGALNDGRERAPLDLNEAPEGQLVEHDVRRIEGENLPVFLIGECALKAKGFKKAAGGGEVAGLEFNLLPDFWDGTREFVRKKDGAILPEPEDGARPAETPVRGVEADVSFQDARRQHAGAEGK